MTNIQDSLFPDNKAAFDAETFANEQINDGFKDWITNAVLTGFSNLLRMCEIQPLTRRAKSDVLHDSIFAQIEQGAHSLPEDMNPVFYGDFSGNQKQFFDYNGYRYILRKAGSGTNDTKVNSAILNQELSMHVITIEYTVSPLWDAINTITFKYIKGDGVEFEYTIPTNLAASNIISDTPAIISGETTSTYTPRFKQTRQNKAL